MVKAMVIVESPTKVKTINKILGKKYKVVSSMGHLIDLPKSKLGVDVEDNFTPKLIVVRSKQKILTQLRKEAKTKKDIYLATDPDREGEAIGWNLAQELGDDKNFYRVTFQEITKDAVLKAFEQPKEFDQKKINAQVARRILDRIVGYEISPLLWKKVGSRLSAGRVQSVALRLIVEREKQIKAFIPQEYWEIAVDLKKEGETQVFTAGLEKIGGEKPELKTEEQTMAIVEEIKKESFVVSKITQREVRRRPGPPLITSTMQQEAFNKLNFNANKTMMLAQQLYEGIDLGGEETVGLITYMRTDSVNISQEALGKLREHIQKEYGPKYLPETPNKYKSKKSAQEAHEAIRPTDVLRTPAEVKDYLEPDQLKLYQLIWNRFVGSQMVPAVYQNKKMEILAGRFQFGASGSTLIFDGYLTLDKELKAEEAKIDFSRYKKDDALELVETKPSQHFTKPPPRYSDASLVKALEEDGIGRPSTYASIIQTLVFRNYVIRDRGYFKAADLGVLVCDLLVEYFPKIMDVGFTAKMEESLDLIEDGDLERTKLLQEFYKPFKEELDYASENIEKTEEVVMDRTCPQCQKNMVVKWGRNGRFLSCSGFPECKYAEPYPTGFQCPDCGGEVVERRSRRGAIFYGCNKYPDCRFIVNRLPEEQSELKSSKSREAETKESS